MTNSPNFAIISRDWLPNFTISRDWLVNFIDFFSQSIDELSNFFSCEQLKNFVNFTSNPTDEFHIFFLLPIGKFCEFFLATYWWIYGHFRQQTEEFLNFLCNWLTNFSTFFTQLINKFCNVMPVTEWWNVWFPPLPPIKWRNLRFFPCGRVTNIATD